MMTIGIKPAFMIPACYAPRNKMKMDSRSSSHDIKKQELSIQLQKNSSQTHLQFDRQQPADQLLVQNKKHDFGKFVAREAVLDEEYWTAAWLRAETHWENRTDDRFADSYKRKFTEQVKKEHRNERHTVLKSVVGTLDVSIRSFLHGETFPGEKIKGPIFHSTEKKEPKSQYAYIANLCVAKSARRQGIARNMLHFAIEFAISDGAGQVYVHVHRNNIAAQELYQKIGFKVVNLASPQLSHDKMYLLCYRP